MRWLLVCVLLLASLLTSAWMLDAMDVIDSKDIGTSALSRIPLLEEHLAVYRLGTQAQRIIDRQEREAALMQAELAAIRKDLELERASLERERIAIASERAELEQLRLELDQRAADLSSKDHTVADFDRLQRMYAQMRPRDVAPILAELDDTVVARLLAGMAIDRAAAILSELPPERAAVVSIAIGGISPQ